MTVLTADCGATHTSWTIYNGKGEKLKAGLLDGINFFEEKEEGLSRFLKQISELNLDPVDYAAFSMAGTGISVYHSRALATFRLMRKMIPATKGVFLFNDAEAALWNSFGGGPGVTVISGTGAIAYGKNRKGDVFRCGGWGVWAGDEGSAYWIAQEAVRAVFHHYDGRYKETLLTEMILDKFKLRSVPDLIPLLHSLDITKKEIASIAMEVSTAATLKDPIAERILNEAGSNLAEQAHAIIRQIGYSADLKVSCQGSVLQKDEIVRNSFLKDLREIYRGIEIIERKDRSEWGVFLLIQNALENKKISPEIL